MHEAVIGNVQNQTVRMLLAHLISSHQFIREHSILKDHETLPYTIS